MSFYYGLAEWAEKQTEVKLYSIKVLEKYFIKA